MDRAADDLIRRLRKNPGDSDAFAALSEHYRRKGDAPSLTNLLEGWAARCAEGEAAGRAFYDAGEVALTSLGNRERAVGLFYRALERNPLQGHASARLQQIFEQAGDGERLVDILERRAGALGAAREDPRQIAAIHHQLGDLLQHRFGQVDRATFHYRKAFELDPTMVAAIYAAREIYRAQGNYRATATLFELEAKAEVDPSRRLALWRELAQLSVRENGDHAGAVRALEEALKLAPRELGVMHELATAHVGASGRGEPTQAALHRRRAADLWVELTGLVGPEHGFAYAESALDAAPDHERALAALERIAHLLRRDGALPARWVQYLQFTPHGARADDIRLRLAHAYIDSDQTEDAIICLEPLLEQNHAEAAELLVDLYRDEQREEDLLRALSVSIAGLPEDRRLVRLREIIPMLVAQGQREAATNYAREIVRIDPSDGEAIAFLEADLRSQGDFLGLRELLVAAARVPGASISSRKLRLREIADLSTHKLHDPEGGIEAWRALIAIDPADREAREALRTLLEKTARWDDLAILLNQDVHLVSDREEKIDLLRRLARIQRNERQDIPQAIEVLRSVYALAPEDQSARDELCDLLLAAKAFIEAVPLLRKRIASTDASAEKLRLLGVLAHVLEEETGDDEGAFEVCTQMLDLAAQDFETIDRMERIDVRAKKFERLLETLSYRAEITTGADRGAIFGRMGAIAYERLEDIDRAVEYFTRGLDLSPGDPFTLDALCRVYDDAGRHRDLVVLLRERAKAETSRKAKAELYRRIARVLADRVGNADAAAEAYTEVLVAGEDREALRYLADRAKRKETPEVHGKLLLRLAAVVETKQDQADLETEYAWLLAGELGKPDEAIERLKNVLETLVPHHRAALKHLASLSEEHKKHGVLAFALERQLEAAEEASVAAKLSARLADLYEQELKDPAKTVERLYTWIRATSDDPNPRRRLVRLLEQLGRHLELLTALDELSVREIDDQGRGNALRHAANIAYRRLDDVEGAWRRLQARVQQLDPAAERDLREIASATGRSAALAEQLITFAQAVEHPPSAQKHFWQEAARIYEEDVHDANQALEAMLRALALDIDDTEVLHAVDRLAGTAAAWARLGQVYDNLLKRKTDDAGKVELLMRLGDLLDREGMDPSAALDRVLRACALAPHDDTILERAEELAPSAQRVEELLIVYDRRRVAAKDPAGRIEALLRAAYQCAVGLADPERTLGYLQQAVRVTLEEPSLHGRIEMVVRELDRRGGAQGGNALRRALIDIDRTVAEESSAKPERAAQLLHQAARFAAQELKDDATAFGAMQAAVAAWPGNEQFLTELEELAERTGKLVDLDALYRKLITEAIDSVVASDLLRRRARLLEEELGRWDEAADVYRHLMSVDPRHAFASDRLKECLRRAGKHKDLLLVLEQEIERSLQPDQTLGAAKEVAQLWEKVLNNRWEALEAWQRALTLHPDDSESQEAVQRLGAAVRARAERPVVEPLADTAPSSRPPASPESSADGFETATDLTDPGHEPETDEEFGPDDPFLDGALEPIRTVPGQELPPKLLETRPATPSQAARPRMSDETVQPAADTPIAIEPDAIPPSDSADVEAMELLLEEDTRTDAPGGAGGVVARETKVRAAETGAFETTSPSGSAIDLHVEHVNLETGSAIDIEVDVDEENADEEELPLDSSELTLLEEIDDENEKGR